MKKTSVATIDGSYLGSMVLRIGHALIAYSNGELVAVIRGGEGWVNRNNVYHRELIARWINQNALSSKLVDQEDLADIFTKVVLAEMEKDIKKRLMGAD